MEPHEIRELIELISHSNFSTFELERDGFRIRLVKGEVGNPAAAGPGAVHVDSAPESQPAASLPPPTTASAPSAPAAEAPAAATELYELRSPIVGTYYSAPSPGSPNFIEVGGRVSQGQVLCIVEAMKVMNEIESEIAAEVVEIPVKNGQPVEYGEVLVRLRPLGGS